MNNNIILDSTTKETKIYKANFDRYIQSGSGNVSINFINIQDEGGSIIKKSFIISSSKALNLIGNMLPGQLISFKAKRINDEEYLDGFDFTDITFFGFN